MSSRSSVRHLIISLLVILTPLCNAAIEVKLQAPQWAFLLHNLPLGKTEAQLAPHESRFARMLQPLLAAQNHQAVLKAFSERNIDHDGAALRQLRGQILISLKRYKEAEHALQAALQLMPDLALAHRSLSMVYMIDQRYGEARKHLRRCIELGVGDAQVYGQLAYVNLQQGRSASALAGYQYALFLDPSNSQWQQGLLYALIDSQAFDQAQALLEEMLDKDTSNIALWLQRSQIAFKQDRRLQALSSLETALYLGDSSLENIVTAAQLHMQSGSTGRAVELLANNISRFARGGDGGRIEALDQICAWLAAQQKWQELRKLMTSLGADQAEFPSTYRARFAVYQAQLALHSGDRKQAKTRLKNALTEDPSNGEALLTFANLLRDDQGFEQSLLYYVRAEALPAFKEQALLGRAQLEISRQNYREALRLLHQVVQLNPGRKDLLVNIQSLENLVRNQG